MQFSYNLANLPENVEGTGGASLTYSYLSDGSKWRASANDGPSILYRGSFVYEDDGNSSRISSIAWDEGRISYHYAPEIEPVDSLAFDFGEGFVDSLLVVDSLVVEDGICDEWHVRDHLGSVRAIAGIGNQITGIRELNTYLPFGTRIPGSIQAADNRHRFGGKEEQRYGIDAATGSPAIDLGLLDFGARYYDPFSCRWTTRDPMAGKYLSLSPYNYCAGNPVSYVDSEGSVIAIWYNDNNGKQNCFMYSGKETNNTGNQYVKDVIDAYTYNKTNWEKAGFSGVSPLAELVERKETTSIISYNKTESHFEMQNGGRPVIYWNSNEGSLFDTGVVSSPASILSHEADHANDAIDNEYQHNIRNSTPDSSYDTAEEKRVIKGSEQLTAIANGEIKKGEITRTNHNGKTIIVSGGPTSTK